MYFQSKIKSKNLTNHTKSCTNDVKFTRQGLQDMLTCWSEVASILYASSWFFNTEEKMLINVDMIKNSRGQSKMRLSN